MVTRLMRWLIRVLYPPSWRRRYEEEFRAVWEQEPMSPKLAWDIAVGGLDARWRARSGVHSTSEWLACLATGWALAAGLAIFFLPSGISCVQAMGTGRDHCVSTTLAASLPSGLAMLCVVLLVLFAILPFQFRHSRPWLIAWASVILVFFVVSFGLDMWLLPAGMMALLAATLPRRVTSTPD